MGYFNYSPLFQLGDLLVSPGVTAMAVDLMPLLKRHAFGDWGEVCMEDAEANNFALKNDEAILSQYHVTTRLMEQDLLIIMTEGDRSLTVVFMAGESAMHPGG